MDMLSSLLEKFQYIFPDTYKGLFIGKTLEGAANFPKAPWYQFADDTNERGKTLAYSAVVRYCEQKILKPWSDSQDQFIVLICHTDEGLTNNPITCLSVLSAFAFEQGNSTCLEEIERIAGHYENCLDAGLLWNNLGVMFEENALYLKSKDCFTKAKNCFEREVNHLCSAVAMFNLAAFHRVFGEYQRVCHFCTDAVAKCHDISMRTTKDVNLPERVLRRAVDLLEELEDTDRLCNILEIGKQYDICGASEACAVFSTKRLMSIQLKKQNGEDTEEELTDFTCYLLTLMDKQVPELLNADFMGTVMTVAKIKRETGYSEEANKLVEKLKSTFSSTRASRYPLYGMTLFKVGHFKFGSGMVSEARSTLKEADEILTNYFGRNHYVTASCKILMGSCAQQEGNNKDATKHFSEALTSVRKINHQHLEVGEICLKVANLYIEEGKFQLAKEAEQEAVEIFNRVCGEASFKTATGYIKAGVILQKSDEFQDEAADRLRKAIDIYSSLGLRPDHPYLLFCQRLLGNLFLMSGKSEAAEQCLVDAQKQAPLADESYSRKSQCHHVFGTVVNFFTHVLSAEYCIRHHLYLSAEIVALVNLVHLKKGHDRQCYLDALVCSVKKNKTESVEILDFVGHAVYVSHREYCSTPVYVFICLDPGPSPSQFMNDDSNSNRVTLSRSNSSCVLFWRSSNSIQEMKETKSFDVALRESVSTLFLQPKFRKTFEEKRDFYMELAIPTELSDSYPLSCQIEYLPLLLEQNLTDSSQEIASFSSELLPHVSSFCYKFYNQRTAEFAFDHLIHNLSKHLALEKAQVVESSIEPTLKNIVFFPFQQDSFSSLSAVVYICNELPVLAVKCRSLRRSKSNCICSEVQTSLGKVMQSLSELVRVNFETFVQLRCEDVGARSINESLNSNCTSFIKQSSPSFASETVQSLTSATSGHPESELETKQSVHILQSQCVEGAPGPAICSDVSVCLHLLDYVLSERTVLPEEEAVNSHAVSSFNFSSCDSNSQCNHCSDNSLLSACSASSLNSLPTSPSTFSESGPFDQNTCKSYSNMQPSTDKLKEKNLQALPAQNDAEDFSRIKHVSESSCSGDLHENLPFESSDAVGWSSPEEALTTGEINPDLKPNEPKQKEYVHQSQTTSSKGNPGISGSKQGVQGAHATGDFDFKVGLWRESRKCVDVHLEPNQQASSQSSSVLSPSASADNDEYLRNDCPGDPPPNLEDVLREYVNRLEDQTKRLEEQLKKSEEDKKQLQAELGRYLFLEDKQRRSEERQSLSGVSGSDKARLCAAGASPVSAGANGAAGDFPVSTGANSVGGVDPLQESSLTLQTKLLQISDSLTADELKWMKFLAKGKVSGFRLARIREGFELFGELETDGEYQLTFIGQLLERIDRFDLLEMLGLPLSEIVRSDCTIDATMVEQTNGSPENSGNYPEALALRDRLHMKAERQDKETSAAIQTPHASTKTSCNVQSLLRAEAKSKPEKKDFDYSLNGRVSSDGSSDETSNDMPSVSGITGSCACSCPQSSLNAGKKQFWDSCDDNNMSDSSLNTSETSSNSTVRSGLSTQTPSDDTSRDSSDSSSRLSSSTSHSAAATTDISSDSGCNTTSSEDEIIPKSQLLGNEDIVSESGTAAVAGACAANSEDRKKNSLDSCDGPGTTSNTRMTVLDSEVNSTSNSVHGHSRAQDSSDERNGSRLQQSLLDHDETAEGVSSTSSTDWERLGARPKQGLMQRQPPLPAGGVSSGSSADWERLGARPKLVQIQRQPPESMPQEIINPLSDGLTGDFLARHSQDSALHQSLYRDAPDLSLFNEAPLQGASFADGVLNASESNAVRPYIRDCQVASETYPRSRLGKSGIGLMGGCSYTGHLSSNHGLPMGLLPSNLGSNNFSFGRNYLSVSGSNVANGHSSQSSFVNNAYGFPRAGPFSRQSYVQYDQHSHASVYQLGQRNQPYTGFPQPNFAEDAALGAAGFQLTGHSLYSAQSCNDSATTPGKDMKQTSQLANLALPDQSNSFANSDHEPSVSTGNTIGADAANSGLLAPCSVPSYVHATSGTVSTTTSLPSLVCTSSNTVTLRTGNDDISRLIASRVAADGEENSVVPLSGSGNAGNDNSSSSTLNRDLVANSGEGTDSSLLALEQRVAEACALVERVLRDREEREQFGREIERKEQMIREQRERERREREEREIEEAERWPQNQEAITARSQWLCEHYQRHCRVRFPCCGQFYPCHRCHNNSQACDNQEAKACHATHLQCNHCQHEQEIDENSGTCGKCEGKMSAYFCSICKHFTSVDKNPYHCEKCGICRIHKDKSFHCDVCNVCLDKRLEGNHKCRPDSGHDECCICLEDAFSGCQILPCSHKVHRECAIAMIQNGIRTCPICRHPLYSQSRR